AQQRVTRTRRGGDRLGRIRRDGPGSTRHLSSSVTVRVLLFASYAEALGHAAVTLTVPAPATIAAVLDALHRQPGGDLLPERPLVAVNLEQAGLDSPVKAGDEIAVLPPLAGG